MSETSQLLTAETPNTALAGRIGPYRVEGRLGKGGMGEVYRGFDERLDRPVALKRIKPDANQRETSRKRFRREAKIVAKLSHGAVVQVYDWVETDDSDWIVMELVDGQSLRDVLEPGPLALDEAVRIAREIAGGLAAAHDVGLVHRDLKPDNVMVTAGGAVKILDFGLAKQITTDEEPISSISIEGQIQGTVTYMSPEQAKGQSVDHRSDLFALGAILYQSVTGALPFRGQNAVETLTQICTVKHKAIGDLRLGVPKELTTLIDGLLQKSPARRPSSAGLVITGLDRARDAILASPAARASMPIAAMSPESEIGPASSSGTSNIQLKTLLLSDLVDSTKLVYNLGDERSAQVFRRHDQVARELLAAHDGLEIDKSDGFLMLFERPIDAVTFALAYHQALAELSIELEVQLRTRVGIHLGEVVLSENTPEEIARGAKPLEVEGLAKPTAARIMSLAQGRQTLMSNSAFHMAREAAADTDLADRELRWLAHGPYLFKGVPDPVEVFEVGIPEVSLLEVPPDSEKVRRAVAAGDEMTLGWRPGPGQEIPRRDGWALERELGRGGFGEVWLARHDDTGEPRVFKFCHDPEQLRSFQREVTLFRLLKDSLGDHPRIARILDWSFDEAPYFIEAEYISGGDLLDWSEQRGGIAEVPMEDRLEIVAQIGDALGAAHSVGILHKDVKPGNILIAEDREEQAQVKLTDFGIAQLLDKRELLARGITMQGMTEELDAAGPTSSIAGSHIYMAPEVSEGKMATVQADVYAVGVLLYQMVVGELGRALAPGWQRDVEDEILAEDIACFVDGEPSRRPGSAKEIADRLRGLAERRADRERLEEAEQTRRALADSQRRRKWATWVAAVAVVVLAVVSILAVIAVNARQEAEASREVAVQRRSQAENLISFMLGDLRTKLEGVGRLPILDDVGAKAIEYFAAVPEDELSDEELARRSTALYQIGEVRINQGQLPEAIKPLEESLALARVLVERDPENGQRLFDLGQSEFWVGFVAYRQGDLDRAQPYFEHYLRISETLVRMDADNLDWQLELSYAHSNLGSMLQERRDLDGALERFQAVLAIDEMLARKDPDRADWKYERAATHNTIGAVLLKKARLAEAQEQFAKELQIRQELSEIDPSNKDWQRRLGIAHEFLGETFVKQDLLGDTHRHHGAGVAIFEALTDYDPTNLEWQFDLANARWHLAKVLWLMSQDESAYGVWEKGNHAINRLAEDNPTNRLWQIGLCRSNYLLAQLLVDRQPDMARASLRLAIEQLTALAQQAPGNHELQIWLARSYTLQGLLKKNQDDVGGAIAEWSRAEEIISSLAQESEDIDILISRATILLYLGHTEQAKVIIDELDRFGVKNFDLSRALFPNGKYNVSRAPAHSVNINERNKEEA